MPILILSPRNTQDSLTLLQTAFQQGWKVYKLANWRIPDNFEETDKIAIYGEPLFAKIIAAQLNKVLLEPMHNWLTQLDFSYTQRKIDYLPLKALEKISFPSFIKPPDDKLFPAKIYQSPQEILEQKHIDKEQYILTSQPVSFIKEFRLHILQNEILGCSRYAVDGKLDITCQDKDIKNAIDFTQSLIQNLSHTLPPVIVIDVGLLNTKQWAVIEANPCFGSGLYANPPYAILTMLLVCCRDLSENIEELQKFKYPLVLD